MKKLQISPVLNFIPWYRLNCKEHVQRMSFNNVQYIGYHKVSPELDTQEDLLKDMKDKEVSKF